MTTEQTQHPCGDWPAPCNCDDPQTHDGATTAAAPTLTAADVLRAHPPVTNTDGDYLRCENPSCAPTLDHAEHQSDMLTAAGFLTRPDVGAERLRAVLSLRGELGPDGVVFGCPWCSDVWESEATCEHARAVTEHNTKVAARALWDVSDSLCRHDEDFVLAESDRLSGETTH